MKKALLPPLSVLAIILTFSLWNNASMEKHTSRWHNQLLEVSALAQAEKWEQAQSALKNSYVDWSSLQTWLHIVTEHDAVDDAEAMYHRAAAFAAAEDPNEFQAELADLRDQLRLLAEMEQLNAKNIL